VIYANDAIRNLVFWISQGIINAGDILPTTATAAAAAKDVDMTCVFIHTHRSRLPSK
jgi:hypothetical protein